MRNESKEAGIHRRNAGWHAMKTNCTMTDEDLADLLLDPHRVSSTVSSHVAACDRCQAELAEIAAAMALLDPWEAPDPSPYFMTRLGARLREEREAAPTGWFRRTWARLCAGFAYGPGLQARPLTAMVLTTVLLVGGGAYLGVTDWMQPAQPSSMAAAATVQDLQALDSNAQALDALAAISGNENGD